MWPLEHALVALPSPELPAQILEQVLGFTQAESVLWRRLMQAVRIFPVTELWFLVISLLNGVSIICKLKVISPPPVWAKLNLYSVIANVCCYLMNAFSFVLIYLLPNWLSVDFQKVFF